MTFDGIQIAPEEAYMKSVSGDRPMTRKEALELVDLLKSARAANIDYKVKWYISTEISRLLENIVRGSYGS